MGNLEWIFAISSFCIIMRILIVIQNRIAEADARITMLEGKISYLIQRLRSEQ